MLRVGIIAEGKSEWLVLEAIMRKLHADIEFERLRPDLTLASMSPHGWRGVKAWCKEMGPTLETFMTGVKGRELHLLVIHADCSMAQHEEADRPCPPAADTAAALRQVILEQWLGRNDSPPFVVLALPSKSTDAWVVAALTPPYSRLASVECEWNAENELVARKLLRKKDGAVKKSEVQYRPLAEQTARRLDEVQAHCGQAHRFIEDFQAATAHSLLLTTPEP
jgi:hypothetical protein